MSTPQVFVVRDRDLLLDAAAARLVTSLVDRLAAAGRASLLLSADEIVADLLSVVAAGNASHAVDWRAVSVWWANDSWPDREPGSNRAVKTLRDLGVPETNLHRVPLDAESAGNPEVAAGRYAEELSAARASTDHTSVPEFDVVLLEVAPDGSVAGLRPERPSAYDADPVTVDRLSHQVTVTAVALRAAHEIWLLASGVQASPGVRLALMDAGAVQVPAAHIRGLSRTLLLADADAARRLPAQLRRIASP